MQDHLFEVIEKELKGGRPAVRAVIVKTWGSTPREVGAALVVDSQGALRGTVGGGCGEAEVYELALTMLADDSSSPGHLLHVDLTEDPEGGGGKVCGGRFDVLLQRFDPDRHTETFAGLLTRLQGGRSLVWESKLGAARIGFWREGLEKCAVDFQVGLCEEEVRDPKWISGDELHDSRFLEPLGCTRTLIIVGAGHIARPLCTMATELDYSVMILDDRQEYAQSIYFPTAREVHCGDYDKLLPALASRPNCSVVLVTRGHKHDQDCLRLLGGTELDYLGMIGSQRRIDAVFQELVDEGFCAEKLRRVCAPIGLEIGAQTPSEIACSILAQMIRLRRMPAGSGREAPDRKRHLRSLKSSKE